MGECDEDVHVLHLDHTVEWATTAQHTILSKPFPALALIREPPVYHPTMGKAIINISRLVSADSNP
jgi:hypothetical protein